MHLSDFDYELPEELIAQEPLAQRDASRMLILDRATQTHQDSKFELLPDYIRAGDVVVPLRPALCALPLAPRRRTAIGEPWKTPARH